VLALLLVPALAYGGGSAALARAGSPSRPLLIKLSFHRVDGPIYSVLVSGDFAFLVDSYSSTMNSSAGVLLNERTGSRRQVNLPGCSPRALGPPWLLFSCSAQDPASGLEAYSLNSGKTIDIPAATPEQLCEVATECEPVAVAVGAHWVEFENRNCGEHCAPEHAFEDIGSGAVRRDPTSSTTIPDLNSASLGYRVCTPLRVPRVYQFDFSSWGSLTFQGRFAVAYGTDVNGRAFFHLEHCGSGVQRSIPFESSQLFPVHNRTSVMWWPQLIPRDQLSGVFIPQLRAFSIRLPKAIGPTPLAALSTRTLYLLDGTRLWTARAPTGP